MTEVQIDDLLHKLDFFASEVKAEEYGLPVYRLDAMEKMRGMVKDALAAASPGEPKLVLALPDYEKRRIEVASDEVIDGERLVCLAIKEASVITAAPVAAHDRCERCKGGLDLPNKKCPAGKHDCTVYPVAAAASAPENKSNLPCDTRVTLDEIRAAPPATELLNTLLTSFETIQAHPKSFWDCATEIAAIREALAIAPSSPQWQCKIEENCQCSRDNRPYCNNKVSLAVQLGLETLLMEHRIQITPEYEGAWRADLYGDEAEPITVGVGSTPGKAAEEAISRRDAI